jgi:hypothetical protein
MPTASYGVGAVRPPQAPPRRVGAAAPGGAGFAPPLQAATTLLAAGLAITAWWWLPSLLVPLNSDYASGILVVPVLALANYFLLFKVSRRDTALRPLIAVVWCMKLAAAGG